MSDVTTLVCWPACVDDIDWSEDGIIAAASDEKVELLFPHTESKDSEHDFSSWHHIPLPVSWFSIEELPEKEAAPVETYSIGEEISPSAPVSISWSPPGVAKHRRCALGVLTSSLVLSVWASDGKVEDGDSWRRTLIVNDALIEYFARTRGTVDEASTLTDKIIEKMRLRARIRCFAWAPPLPSHGSGAIIGTQPSWGQPIVAVSNDDNQVAFVAIDSPTSTLGAGQDWYGQVWKHFSIIPDSDGVATVPDTFDDIMGQQRHVSHIAWSPWTIKGDWYYSVLVYATNEDVRARTVTYSGESLGLGDEIIYPDISIRFAGPMKWSQRILDEDKVILALFTPDDIVVLTISAYNATELSRVEHHLDDRWDEISAAAWDFTDPDPIIHFASLQSTLNYMTTALKLSNNNTQLTPIAWPNWREQLADSQALFSAQHELKGNARTKVWGLSTSPLADYIAACSTTHPSDMIEYGQPVERRTTIAISGLREYDEQAKLEIPSQNFTAEGFVFTLRKWLESETTAASIEEVASRLVEKHWVPEKLEEAQEEEGDLKRLVCLAKKNIMFNEHTIKDRCHILASQTLAPSISTDLQRTLIAYRLALGAQKLPASIANATPFSAEIREHHRHVVMLIDSVLNEGAASAPLQPCDICDICSSPIYLTDLTSAACRSGHQYPRCGLSFLAIQVPGITKYCGLCRTPYLSEEFVRLQEVGSRPPSRQASGQPEGLLPSVETGEFKGEQGKPEDEGVPLPVSFARVLFSGCDVCVYCGGKFTG